MNNQFRLHCLLFCFKALTWWYCFLQNGQAEVVWFPLRMVYKMMVAYWRPRSIGRPCIQIHTEILVKPNLISLRINCKYNDHSPNSKWICQIHQKWMYKFCNALRKLWVIFKCIKTNLEGFPGWISCGNEAFIDLER